MATSGDEDEQQPLLHEQHPLLHEAGGPRWRQGEMTHEQKLLYVLLSLRFCESFAYFTLSNIFTLHLSSQFGLDDAAAGALFGLRGAVSHVYGTVLGPIVDSVGLRRCLFFGFALSTVGRLLFACASTTRTVALAVYIPMAMGHSLVGCSLTIGIKRVTNSTPSAGGTDTTWGFALAYCASVCGIAFCGPTIDIATALMAPWPPYRRLALITSVISASAAIVSALAFRCAPSPLVEPLLARQPEKTGSSSSSNRSLSRYCADLSQVVCSRRFLRFALFSVAMLPGLTVLRNLDGGIFPKFMLRTFGPGVPKGTIYALNPVLGLLLAPSLVACLSTAPLWSIIRAGVTLAALSPTLVTFFGPSIPSVVGFVLVLTLGDSLYSPRMDAYAMTVAPVGREGTFAGAAAALVFLAEAPAGVLGGFLLERFCSELVPPPDLGASVGASVGSVPTCDGRRLFGALAGFASISPLLLWSCPSIFRDKAHSSGTDVASTGGTGSRESLGDDGEGAALAAEGSSAHASGDGGAFSERSCADLRKRQLERDLQRRQAADGAAGLVNGGRPIEELVALEALVEGDDEFLEHR